MSAHPCESAALYVNAGEGVVCTQARENCSSKDAALLLVAEKEADLASIVQRRALLLHKTRQLQVEQAVTKCNDSDFPCAELLQHAELVSESAVLDDQIASLRHKIEEERQKELEMMRKKAEYFADKSTCLKEKQHELAVIEEEIAKLKDQEHVKPLLSTIEDLEDQTQLTYAEHESLLNALQRAKKNKQNLQHEMSELNMMKCTDFTEINNKIGDKETRLAKLYAEERELDARVDEQYTLNQEKQQELEDLHAEITKLKSAVASLT